MSAFDRSYKEDESQAAKDARISNFLNNEIEETKSSYEDKVREATVEEIKHGTSKDRVLWPNGKIGWFAASAYSPPHESEVKYMASTTFKYPHWRRIEDRRIVTSITGIKVAEGKKYRLELHEPVTDLKEQREAIMELIDATVEYGHVAPEPCTERWIDSNNEQLNSLQHFRIELYNLYQEHKILSFTKEDKEEREAIFNFVKNTKYPRHAIKELTDDYRSGMFDKDKQASKYLKKINTSGARQKVIE